MPNVYFKDGKVLFDRFGRISFCANCECGARNDLPAPAAWPDDVTLPSCVAVMKTNFTACVGCVDTDTEGSLPIELYQDTESYTVPNDVVHRLPDDDYVVEATITLVASKWTLIVQCFDGVTASDLWTGEKDTGLSPIGTYIRTGGCDEAEQVTVI